MAGSRLEKLGTVYSRVRDLMRAGVMKPSQKPIWYDVYAAFPPKREPLYEEPKEIIMGKVDDNIRPIFYEEDNIRAKFYEVYGSGPKAFNLFQQNFKSTSQRFIEKYNELKKAGETDEEKLFENTGKALLSEGIILRRKGTAPVRQQTTPEIGRIEPGFKIDLKYLMEEYPQEDEYPTLPEEDEHPTLPEEDERTTSTETNQKPPSLH